MANSTSNIPQVIEGTGAVAKVNTLTDAGSPAMTGARDATTTALLVWGFLGGRINGVDKANGTVALTASNTNYVVMAKSGLAVTAATTTTNWNDTANYWRLYSVVTNSTTATSYNDERFSSLGMVQPALGAGSNGQVWGVAAGVPGWITVAGTGDVVGPASSTDDRIATFDGATGKLIQDGGDTIASLSTTLRQIPQNSQSTAYTLVLADAGKHILHPSADTTARVFTIPANSSVAYPIGTAVTFVNQNAAGVITIAITTDTMRLAGAGTTGSRTLAANGTATALKITSTEWIISGVGLT